MSKEIKKNLIPNLRFPEFAKKPTWKEKRLSEVLFEHDERSTGKEEVFSVSVHKGVVNQIEHLGRSFSAANTEHYKRVLPGDIIYTKSPTGDFPFGIIKQSKVSKPVIVSPLYGVFKPETNALGVILDAYFEYPGNVYNYLSSIIQKGAKNTININNDTFLSKSLVLPTNKDEQQKIADCLSSLDELITAENQKLEALQQHKKGLMQQLFPAKGERVPKLRFKEFRDSGDWEILPLGEKIELISGFPFSGSDILENPTGVPLMRGINITEGYIRHNSDIDRFYIGKLDGLEKYYLKKDDLVIGMDGSKVGKNSSLINDKDTGALLVQRVARLRAKKRVSIQFIFQIINSAIFHSYVNRINTSSGIPHISAKQIEDFQIFFPSYEEQCKVAFCLCSLNDLISSVSQRIDSLKAHKKGLMQQLFPTSIEN